MGEGAQRKSKGWPSVTQVIGRFYDGYDHVPEYMMEQGAERGKKVHKATLVHALRLWNPIIREVEGDPALSGYFQSIKVWLDEYVAEVLLAEEELADPVHRFIGHPDLICRLITKEIVGVDWKTSITASPAWRLQMAGYCILSRREFSDLDRFMVIQPKKSGKMAKAITYINQARDEAVFLSAVGVVNYLKGD